MRSRTHVGPAQVNSGERECRHGRTSDLPVRVCLGLDADEVTPPPGSIVRGADHPRAGQPSVQREAGNEPIPVRVQPGEPDPRDADEPGLLCAVTWISPRECSIETHARARSSVAGPALANTASSVNCPQECHRFRLTNPAPHRGHIQTGGIPRAVSPHSTTWPSHRLRLEHRLLWSRPGPAILPRPQAKPAGRAALPWANQPGGSLHSGFVSALSVMSLAATDGPRLMPRLYCGARQDSR